MADVKLGRYRNYKNNEYQVIGIALDTETRSKVIVYRALYECADLAEEYGNYPIFVRSYELFNKMIEVDGVEVPRFTYIGD